MYSSGSIENLWWPPINIWRAKGSVQLLVFDSTSSPAFYLGVINQVEGEEEDTDTGVDEMECLETGPNGKDEHTGPNGKDEHNEAEESEDHEDAVEPSATYGEVKLGLKHLVENSSATDSCLESKDCETDDDESSHSRSDDDDVGGVEHAQLAG